MNNKSRAYTEEEMQELFLDNVRVMIQYWENETRASTSFDKLEGLAHSILVAIDGESCAVPGFKLIPDPHSEDKQFHINKGSNYYPEDFDIAGSLHDNLFKKRENGKENTKEN